MFYDHKFLMLQFYWSLITYAMKNTIKTDHEIKQKEKKLNAWDMGAFDKADHICTFNKVENKGHFQNQSSNNGISAYPGERGNTCFSPRKLPARAIHLIVYIHFHDRTKDEAFESFLSFF